MAVRGVRGATTVEADDAALIHAAARELMEEILRRNQIADFDDVISAVFTTTVDLVSAFPAEAARAHRHEPSAAAVRDRNPRCRCDATLHPRTAAHQFGSYTQRDRTRLSP